jgi:hypothetical protein
MGTTTIAASAVDAQSAPRVLKIFLIQSSPIASRRPAIAAGSTPFFTHFADTSVRHCENEVAIA